MVMGSNFVDVDNDGYLDMYLGTGSPPYSFLVPNRMFRNDRAQRFVDIAENCGYWWFVVLSWVPIYLVVYWAERF